MKKFNSASGIYILCGGIFTLAGSVSAVTAGFLALHMDYVRLHGEGDVEILPYIFGLLGAISLLVGVGFLAVFFRAGAVRKKLTQSGVYVMAEITGFPADYSVRVNRMPTYRMECAYRDPASGVVHIFRSDPLVFDPSGYVTSQTVRVYVDRESDYRTYYVDAESVMPEIRQH